MSFGGTGSTPVGTPAMVADVFETWMNEADIDGFNVMQYLSPTSYEDVVELLVPELQRKGIYWNDYPVPGGTLRENMMAQEGASSIDADHPAHKKKWNVRETNGPSAWDSRVNRFEAAEKTDTVTNGAEKMDVVV